MELFRYNGIRTLEAFAEFINAEGGNVKFPNFPIKPTTIPQVLNKILTVVIPLTKIKVPVNPSHVVEVTAESFDEVIFDITKHVLVEFCAPWLVLN